MGHMDDVHDHEPDAFDHLLDAAQASRVEPNPDIEVVVSVPLSPTTLTALTERATREGRDIADVVADALRAAAA